MVQYTAAVINSLHSRIDQHQTMSVEEGAPSLSDAASLIASYGVILQNTHTIMRVYHLWIGIILLFLIGPKYIGTWGLSVFKMVYVIPGGVTRRVNPPRPVSLLPGTHAPTSLIADNILRLADVEMVKRDESTLTRPLLPLD